MLRPTRIMGLKKAPIRRRAARRWSGSCSGSSGLLPVLRHQIRRRLKKSAIQVGSPPCHATLTSRVRLRCKHCELGLKHIVGHPQVPSPVDDLAQEEAVFAARLQLRGRLAADENAIGCWHPVLHGCRIRSGQGRALARPNSRLSEILLWTSFIAMVTTLMMPRVCVGTAKSDHPSKSSATERKRNDQGGGAVNIGQGSKDLISSDRAGLRVVCWQNRFQRSAARVALIEAGRPICISRST